MLVRRSPLLLLLTTLVTGACCCAQVMMPAELPDPSSQRLQQRHIKALMSIGVEVEAHKFPYPFYFTRVLDVDLAKMQAADQRSIRFDIYKGQTVLELTGDYYAAYSAELVDTETRLKETFKQVILPILEVETRHFPDDSEFVAFAIEVAHHVRQKMMGVSSKRPENVMIFIPVPAAQKLVDAKNDDERQAALLESKIFVNGELYSLWLGEGAPPEEWRERPVAPEKTLPAAAPVAPGQPTAVTPTVSSALLKKTATPMRILKPEDLSNLQLQNEATIEIITKGLNSEAHFVPYVEPAFIGFRQGAYLSFLSLHMSMRRQARRGISWPPWLSTNMFPILYVPSSRTFPRRLILTASASAA